MLKLIHGICLIFSACSTPCTITLRAQPASACAFRFQVVDRGGKGLEALPARLLSVSGREQYKVTDTDGKVEFCDARLEFHELTIGGPTCGQMRISYLQPLLPQTQEMTFVYQNCHSHVALGYCSLIIRYESARGVPWKGLVIRAVRNPGTVSQGVTDGFGRLFIDAPYDSIVQLSARVSDGRASEITLPCVPGKGGIMEKIVLTDP